MEDFKKKEIRIKSFRTQSFDELIEQVNIWLKSKQDSPRNTFEFIDMKYYCKECTSSENDNQHIAIVIFKDSQHTFTKEELNSNTTNDEEFIAEKRKLEYRK
jgi:hypothetical protein